MLSRTLRSAWLSRRWRSISQCLFSTRKAPSDHGGIDIAECVRENQTFDAPRCRVLGVWSHVASFSESHGRRPRHRVISFIAVLVKAPSIVARFLHVQLMTMSASEAVSPAESMVIRCSPSVRGDPAWTQLKYGKSSTWPLTQQMMKRLGMSATPHALHSFLKMLVSLLWRSSRLQDGQCAQVGKRTTGISGPLSLAGGRRKPFTLSRRSRRGS